MMIASAPSLLDEKAIASSVVAGPKARMDAVSDGAPSSGCRPDEKRCLDPRCAPRDGSDAAFDGRFPGSRVFAFGHLPGFPVVSWPSACRLQLRGQPRIEAKGRTAFPFDPP